MNLTLTNILQTLEFDTCRRFKDIRKMCLLKEYQATKCPINNRPIPIRIQSNLDRQKENSKKCIQCRECTFRICKDTVCLQRRPMNFPEWMDNILFVIKNEIYLIYMDDIIFCFPIIHDHLVRLEEVFRRL